jgi:hypothetical protein
MLVMAEAGSLAEVTGLSTIDRSLLAGVTKFDLATTWDFTLHRVVAVLAGCYENTRCRSARQYGV